MILFVFVTIKIYNRYGSVKILRRAERKLRPPLSRHICLFCERALAVWSLHSGSTDEILKTTKRTKWPFAAVVSADVTCTAFLERSPACMHLGTSLISCITRPAFLQGVASIDWGSEQISGAVWHLLRNASVARNGRPKAVTRSCLFQSALRSAGPDCRGGRLQTIFKNATSHRTWQSNTAHSNSFKA